MRGESVRPIRGLSTETLFTPLSESGGDRLLQMLRRISAEVYPFSFVRQLPGKYLSAVQQQILSRGRIPSLPKAAQVVNTLMSYERVFGRDAVTVFPHERNRDVIDDLCFMLGDFGIDRETLGALPRRAYKSLSAASMWVLLAYKKENSHERVGRQLGRILKDLDSELGLEGPQVSPKLYMRLAPDARSLEDWLQEHYGLSFTRPTEPLGTTPDQSNMEIEDRSTSPFTEIEDLTEVSWKDVNALLARLECSKIAQNEPGLGRWISQFRQSEVMRVLGSRSGRV